MAGNGDTSADRQLSLGYQMFVLVLSLVALALTAGTVLVDGSSPTAQLLEYADLAVCAIFLLDFGVSFVHAPNKKRYLLTWGWLDALSAVPTIDFARWGRAARVFRILRVLRALRATRIVASLALRYRARNAVLATGLLLLITIFSCSIAVLYFESDGHGNIQTAPDALWWAISTVTTVGYGDFYPVTWEGRLVATVLMLTGVGIFSTLAGAMSLLFLAPTAHHEDHEIQRLGKEIACLRELLEAQAIMGSTRSKPVDTHDHITTKAVVTG